MTDKRFVVIPSMTGNSGNTKVTINNATFLFVSEEIRRYPDRDFGVWLVEQIGRNKKYFAKEVGLFGIIKSKYYCAECSSQLNPKQRTIMEATINFQYREYEPFTINIVYPSIKCPKCNKVNGIAINDRKGNSIYGAINNAFTKENITP